MSGCNIMEVVGGVEAPSVEENRHPSLQPEGRQAHDEEGEDPQTPLGDEVYDSPPEVEEGQQTKSKSPVQPDTWEGEEEPEIFHDCSLEPEEETLLDLEKELSQEEKVKKKEESAKFKEEGNAEFKKGDYVEAEISYSHGLQVCPACYQKERAILFSNRAAARMKQDKKDSAITDCSKAIKLNPDYIRALLRRAELYEKTDKLDEALEDYKCVLERDPSVHHAREACMRLPKQIEERNEKMKEDMMGKLKDLGNLVLRPFGLSTENFQVNQDSNTGSYSINFVQNPNNNNR